jgi:rubredoxin-NAD+ reductase
MDNAIENFENEGNVHRNNTTEVFMKYICEICNHIYVEAVGDPLSDISAGTLFVNIPNDWKCPECSANKQSFKFLE